jgi:hypothetical protein
MRSEIRAAARADLPAIGRLGGLEMTREPDGLAPPLR